MKALLCVILLASVVLFGCKKDDKDNTPSPTEKEKLLTAPTWKVDEILIVMADGDSMHFNQTNLPSCAADNTYKYKEDKFYLFDDGAEK